MALSTYSELQTSCLDWMERSGATNYVAAAPDWITLAEAKLNRKLGAVETDATLTGTIGSRSIDISSLSIVQPISLFGTEPSDGDEWEVLEKPPGSFRFVDDNGRPRYWSKDGTNLEFERPCDQAYSFRFRYRQRFALSDAAPTNWLLTNHPDVYFTASMMWGAGYSEDWQNGAAWKAVLEQAIPEVRHEIAENNRRGMLSVDPALARIGQGPRYGWDGLED